MAAPATERPIGFGRLTRKEDERFIRGQGRYVDDFQLPGMLHGALLRSPVAVQAVLATDKVRFQGQEVAFLIADDRYSARDALELIEVEYEELSPVVDPRRASETTTSSTGSQAIARPPRRYSPAPTWSSSRRWSSRARIRRRWRPGARWPTSTGSAAS